MTLRVLLVTAIVSSAIACPRAFAQADTSVESTGQILDRFKTVPAVIERVEVPIPGASKPAVFEDVLGFDLKRSFKCIGAKDPWSRGEGEGKDAAVYSFSYGKILESEPSEFLIESHGRMIQGLECRLDGENLGMTVDGESWDSRAILCSDKLKQVTFWFQAMGASLRCNVFGKGADAELHPVWSFRGFRKTWFGSKQRLHCFQEALPESAGDPK